MQLAEDGEILNLAREDDRVCIKLDHDFHTHLAMTGLGRPSVVFCSRLAPR
jgi:predicted nuclease of predicted toxin-antitoxin system